jgi:hypothetical protein
MVGTAQLPCSPLRVRGHQGVPGPPSPVARWRGTPRGQRHEDPRWRSRSSPHAQETPRDESLGTPGGAGLFFASCPARPGPTVRSMSESHPSPPALGRDQLGAHLPPRRARLGAGKAPVGDDEPATPHGLVAELLLHPPHGLVTKALGQPPVTGHPGRVRSLHHHLVPRGQQRGGLV